MQVFLPQKTFKIKLKKNCSFSMNRSLLIVNFHKQPLKNLGKNDQVLWPTLWYSN